MKYRNPNRAPIYVSGHGQVIALRTTADIPDLRNLLKKILAEKADIILDGEELKLIDKLLLRNDQSKKRNDTKVKKEMTVDTAREYQLAQDRKAKEADQIAWEKAKEREQFFEDRKPDNKEAKIEPKKLEGKPKSLADIMNHNATIQ